jgi:hypothetical protein
MTHPSVLKARRRDALERAESVLDELGGFDDDAHKQLREAGGVGDVGNPIRPRARNFEGNAIFTATLLASLADVVMSQATRISELEDRLQAIDERLDGVAETVEFHGTDLDGLHASVTSEARGKDKQ